MSPDQYAERLGEHDRQLQRALHELAQLRSDLARVTSERDSERGWRIDKERLLVNEERAHAETRKMLEALGADYGTLLKESNAYETALASTRAELAQCQRDLAACAESRATAEARVKAATDAVNTARTGAGNNPHWQGWENILESLRG